MILCSLVCLDITLVQTVKSVRILGAAKAYVSDCLGFCWCFRRHIFESFCPANLLFGCLQKPDACHNTVERTPSIHDERCCAAVTLLRWLAASYILPSSDWRQQLGALRLDDTDEIAHVFPCRAAFGTLCNAGPAPAQWLQWDTETSISPSAPQALLPPPALPWTRRTGTVVPGTRACV